MKKLFVILGLISTLLMIAGPVLAHHGRGATFTQVPRTLKVVVTEVAWRNPHVSFWADVKDANGNVTNWAFEGPNVSTMTRQKFFRNTLGIGDEITVTFLPAASGGKVGLFRGLVTADGKLKFSQELIAVD
jgi:hypothetical protein